MSKSQTNQDELIKENNLLRKDLNKVKKDLLAMNKNRDMVANKLLEEHEQYKRILEEKERDNKQTKRQMSQVESDYNKLHKLVEKLEKEKLEAQKEGLMNDKVSYEPSTGRGLTEGLVSGKTQTDQNENLLREMKLREREFENRLQVQNELYAELNKKEEEILQLRIALSEANKNMNDLEKLNRNSSNPREQFVRFLLSVEIERLLTIIKNLTGQTNQKSIKSQKNTEISDSALSKNGQLSLHQMQTASVSSFHNNNRSPSTSRRNANKPCSAFEREIESLTKDTKALRNIVDQSLLSIAAQSQDRENKENNPQTANRPISSTLQTLKGDCRPGETACSHMHSCKICENRLRGMAIEINRLREANCKLMITAQTK